MPNTVGRYEILERIGQGGMGAVYKAFDPLLRRTVAVKLIAAVLDDNPDMRERFFREARAAGQLSHRNIIVIYDLGEERGQPYLAMEFLNGASLETRMGAGGRLSPLRAVEVMIDVCHGLDYAHARGVVHRDVKPANLFITDTNELKILDFGLAHLVSSELTRSEAIMGTANYMAPEQVRGERVDRRADVFAAGVVLYELLACRRAFDGDSFATTLFKVLETMPEPLEGIAPSLPAPLVAAIMRALAKRREDRFQSAADLCHELMRCRDIMSALPAAATPSGDLPTRVGATEPGPSPWPAPTPWSAPAPTPAPMAAPMPPMTPVPTPQPAAAPGPPRSMAWSPRRVRTTAIVGVVLAAAGAALLLGPGDRSPRENTVPAATPSAAPASAPRQQASSPPQTAAPAPASTSGSHATVPPATPTPPATPAPVPSTADRSLATGADRTRADAALVRLARARALADQSEAASLAMADYRDGIATEGEARGLYAAGQYGRAASRATAAEQQYRRAQAAAIAEAQRVERERLAAGAAAQGGPPVEAPRPPSQQPEPPRAEPPKPEPPKPEPPKPEPARSEQVQPAPAPPDPRPAIRAVLDQYVDALEARSVDALKAVWPSLGGAQERAIRAEFENARSLQVRLTEPEIEVAGQSATVTAMRHYQILTTDNHRLAMTTRLTIRLRANGGGWTIEAIGYR